MFIFLLKSLLFSSVVLFSSVGAGALVSQFVDTTPPENESQNQQEIISEPSFTPSPTKTEEVKLNTESKPAIQRITHQAASPPVATPTHLSRPILTPDLDPVIVCKSKTGDIQVRRSVCASNTDCPDGSGGYVFESQESCKQRWQNISNKLKDLSNQYGQALIEQNRLQNQQLLLEQQINNQAALNLQKEFHEKVNQEAQQETQKLNQSLQKSQQELDAYFKNLIKTPTPTPCPKGWYGAEIDVEGPCGN